MIIIGVDFHPEFQQIASVDTDSGEFQEKRLAHREEAEKFYGAVAASGRKVRVGMEASGHARWFERLLAAYTLLFTMKASFVRSASYSMTTCLARLCPRQHCEGLRPKVADLEGHEPIL
jgi:hypothetical protein